MVSVISFKRFFLLILLSGLLAGATTYQTENSIRVYYRQTQIKFALSPVNVNGILYIPLRETAKELGMEWQYDQNRDEYKLIRQADRKELIFKLNSRKLRVNGQWDELGNPVLLIKNAYFVPLNDFLWPLGYFVEKKQNDYFIVTKLKTITWKDRTLRIEGQAPLVVDLERTNLGYQLTIQDCILGMHEDILSVEDGVVQSIEYRQLTLAPARVKVLVRTRERIRYTALQEDDQNAYVLAFDYQPRSTQVFRPVAVEVERNVDLPVQFTTGKSQITLTTTQPQIVEMTYRGEDGNSYLEVKADRPLTWPKQMRLKSPDRLVLDLPGIYTAPINILRVHDKNVQQIRGAQFDKGVVRIVLETNLEPKLEFLDSGRILRVVFAGEKLAVAAVTSPTIPVVITPDVRPRSVLQVHTSPLKGLRIVVIPGHGGTDAGALGRSGEMEKNYTLAVALKIKKILEDKGAIPLLTREDDRNVSLEEQARFANEAKADLLVSIHFNSFIFPNVSGAESYYWKQADKSLAEAVHTEMLKATGLKSKGIKKAMMHNLNHTTMPGVLVEPLFISNRQEEAMLKQESFQWKLAQGIVAGLEKYKRGN